MVYDYPNGYSHDHTSETIAIINNPRRGNGGFKERFNIYLRDGKLTVVHENITKKQLEEIKTEIERQGNRLW